MAIEEVSEEGWLAWVRRKGVVRATVRVRCESRFPVSHGVGLVRFSLRQRRMRNGLREMFVAPVHLVMTIT